MIEALEKHFDIKYGSEKEVDEMYRTVADHIRASVFLVQFGVKPGNKLQGYVLRRLLRRSATKTYLKDRSFKDKSFDSKKYKLLVRRVIDSYPAFFKGADQEEIEQEIVRELRRFRKTIEQGIKKLEKRMSDKQKIDGKFLFDLHQTYGIPYEVTEEIFQKARGKKLTEKDREEFDKKLESHQELSRTASAGMFKGGLADSSAEVTRLHTATHLLHAALRKVLGEHVQQKGSNITAERLRFDFTHPQKLTEDETKRVEDLVNEQIQKDLPVSFEAINLNKAIKEGALAFFGEKYDQKVKVYTVGDPEGKWFSKEVCGGPHVSSTSEIGRVKIFRQEKIGAGIMRLYAKTE